MRSLVAALDSSRAFPAAPRPVAAGGLDLELRHDLQLREADDAALDRLVDAQPEVGVFVSKPWLSGFFTGPDFGFDPAILLFRERAELRAFAPIAIRETLTHVRVRLLGGGLGSDRVDLLAARGYEAVAADTFLAWLHESFRSRGFVLELRDVASTSALWGAIQRAGLERTQRLALQPREIHTLPYLAPLDTPPHLDESPPARSVRSLQKHRRWLERRGEVRIDLLHELGDVLDAFDWLARVLSARWAAEGTGSVLDTLRTARFHRCVLPLLLQHGRLRMMRISADGRTVAVFYGLAASTWWGYYLAGFDREWAGRIHLGRVNLGAAIELAAQEGATEFDFLKGAEPVKYTWPVRERTTLDADVFSENSGVQLTRARRATRDATAALTKSARALFS